MTLELTRQPTLDQLATLNLSGPLSQELLTHILCTCKFVELMNSVDEQGLRFESASTTSSASTFMPGTDSFAFQITTRPQGTGNVMIINNVGAGNDLTVAIASSSSVTVQLGG